MGTTFTCVATGDWNDDATWGLTDGDYPGNGGATDDVVIIDVANKSGGAGALTVTLVADVELKAIKMAGTGAGDATLHTASEHTLTLNDTEFSGYSAHVTGQTEFTGNVNFTFTKSGTTHIIIDPASQTNKLNDITCNHASLALHLLSAITIKGNLICTLGTFSTQSSGGGTSHQVTVAGNINVDGGNLNINDSAVSCAKLIVESGDTITAAHSSNALTVTGAGIGNARSIDFTGAISGTLDIISTHSGTREDDLSASSGVINHLTVNHASAVMRMNASATLANLTITAGQFTTADAGGNSKDLTVTGNTLVDGTLTGNNSTLTFGTDGVHGSTEGGSLLVNSSGTFTFGSGDVTVFGGFTAKGTEGSPNVTSTGGGDILIKGRTNNGFMNSHNHQGTNITGDYIIDYDNNSIFDNRGGVTIACGNFIVKHDGRTYEPWNNAAQATFKIVGNMQIQDGAFDTEYSGQNSQHLTVTGDCIVGDGSGSADTAVLTGNASTISLGSLVINSDGKYDATSETTTITSEGDGSDGSSNGFALDKHASGTFAHNSGTLTVTTNTNTVFRGFEGTDTSGTGANALNNLIVNLTGSATYYVRLRPNSGTAHTILNDVTVTQGKLEKETNDHTLTINGDVNVGANGTLGHADKTGNDTFGSITIGSGGTYNATSGTTTITGESGDGLAINNDGTLTHNKGTVKVDYDSTTSLDLTGTGSVDFYNLIVDSDSTVSYGASVIENNLTKKGAGRMRPNGDSGRNLEVKGTLLVEAGTFGRGANDTHTNTFGNVVITGGTIDLTGGGGSGKTIVKGSFRNVGGTVNTP